MTNYIRRILYIDAEGHHINPLFYPFLVATFVYGFGFAAFSWWSGVNSSSLWGAMHDDSKYMPQVWGALAILAASLAVFLLLYRKVGTIGEFAAMFGFLVWLYAGWIYAQGGYWLVLITVTGPNMYFWGWYYTRVKWWQRQVRAGKIVDAG